MTNTVTPAAIRDLKPGQRVRCYDAFSGTVVRTANAAGAPYVVVDYDHDQGRIAVYPPYVQS